MHLLAAALACHLAGAWSGQTPSGWRLEAQITVDGARAEALVDMPDIAGFARRFTGTAEGCRLRVERPQPAGNPPVVLELEGVGGELRGTAHLFGATAPVVLRRRAAPIPRHREEEVTFTNGPVTLAGTIVRPESGGPHPAVVFTHGGGAETRVIRQSLAVYLARNGLASLVYDKRGTGQSTGEWETASMEELAGDALAGVALLRSRPGIIAERVGIYGYSQGGWIAPLAASLDRRIAFVVAGGASGVNPMEQTIHHRTEVMRGERFDTATVRKAMDLWRALYAARTTDARRAVQETLRSVRGEPWFAASGLPQEIELEPPATMAAFLRFDPVPSWAGVRQPVFVFWGAEDINVPVRESLRILAGAMASDDVTIRLYPGLKHDLRIPAEDLPRASAAAMYDDVALWLSRFIPGASVAPAPPAPAPTSGR